MTTSAPEVTKQIGVELSKDGIHMLDAPVSGGVKKAEDGTLAIMAGGEMDHTAIAKFIEGMAGVEIKV
jgi:3-hydroxyisobutyrate dehydrogenase